MWPSGLWKMGTAVRETEATTAWIPNGGAHYGLTVTGVGNDSKRLVDALKNGKLVIAIMSKGHFTSSGHFIVLRGVTEGKDPGGRSGQRKTEQSGMGAWNHPQ